MKEFSGDIDVDALENRPIFMATRQMKKGAPKQSSEQAAAGDAAKAAQEAEITKKKRKRKKIRKLYRIQLKKLQPTVIIYCEKTHIYARSKMLSIADKLHWYGQC